MKERMRNALAKFAILSEHHRNRTGLRGTMKPVVDMDWLAQHRDEVVVTDVRWYLDGRSGREAYDVGHIPGAVFVGLDDWLAGEGSPDVGRHPLPAPETFARGMSLSGISDSSTVIAYDDAGGVIAARLVWMLRNTGHEAALLDGGLGAYEGNLETHSEEPAPGVFTACAWSPEGLVTIQDVTKGDRILIDARNRDRFRGDSDPIDPRAGHIPGARNVPCRENLNDNGTFLPVDEIRRKFEDIGVVSADSTISYCGSGVTACHNLLALEMCGLGVGRLFPGSWSQYANAAHLPVVSGDDKPLRAP
jgi:thiosulfate/3-mercaptopyruvate sulfurtransferase